ncbi:hypothetical protein SETIT_1G207900v2 [Setaria italica]|uniref:Uncharacterized protein n=1 Tax=Setaria italica TaxID=4555 RepID=A0A368PMH5_SETIT|nr:hypothetical protein SETIT_1G207900v2 [Setaria italica]
MAARTPRHLFPKHGTGWGAPRRRIRAGDCGQLAAADPDPPGDGDAPPQEEAPAQLVLSYRNQRRALDLKVLVGSGKCPDPPHGHGDAAAAKPWRRQRATRPLHH